MSNNSAENAVRIISQQVKKLAEIAEKDPDQVQAAMSQNSELLETAVNNLEEELANHKTGSEEGEEGDYQAGPMPGSMNGSGGRKLKKSSSKSKKSPSKKPVKKSPSKKSAKK
jgi:hypothetical protein